MTNNKALEYMENEIRCIQHSKYCDRDCAKCVLVKEDKPLIEAYGVAISAIEKQIPKKPTPHIVNVERLKIGNARWCKGTTVYRCPCCNDFISRVYDYCYKCGQALDWSEV